MSTDEKGWVLCNACKHPRWVHTVSEGVCITSGCSCEEFVPADMGGEDIDECVHECDLTFGDVIELRKWSLNKVLDIQLDPQTKGYDSTESILNDAEKVFRFLISDKEYNNE